MPLAAGTRLDPYEVLAPIGAGGMGEVYKACDTKLDRLVAIKVLGGNGIKPAHALIKRPVSCLVATGGNCRGRREPCGWP
jgi:serine/threonine protein kinase